MRGSASIQNGKRCLAIARTFARYRRWETLNHDEKRSLWGAACVFSTWLDRHQGRALRASQVAHAIHASYTAYCLHWEGLRRDECRSFADEHPIQQEHYCQAAMGVLAWLQMTAKAER